VQLQHVVAVSPGVYRPGNPLAALPEVIGGVIGSLAWLFAHDAAYDAACWTMGSPFLYASGGLASGEGSCVGAGSGHQQHDRLLSTLVRNAKARARSQLGGRQV